MPSKAPRRAHFQQLADLIYEHAANAGWPSVTYQARYRTVPSAGTGQPRLEGNSIFWKPAWDTDTDGSEHPVSVRSGEPAWDAFVAIALYPDLLAVDAALQAGNEIRTEKPPEQRPRRGLSAFRRE